MTSDEDRATAMSGLNAGVSVDLPLGKSGKKFGIDYSYKSTEFFDGCHSIGARIIL
ncbi:MAG: hypothetical protein IPG39_00430 [Bacteroidetes bacterium]|nr:hypothetical protein [Bacteroidota bacterium]